MLSELENANKLIEEGKLEIQEINEKFKKSL